MTEPTIVCPNCKTEIKLTESLAAPLLESTRLQYEKQIAEKDSQVAKREAAIKTKESELRKAQESLDEQVAERLKTERASIVAEEAKKAKLLLANDLDAQAQQLAELKDVLKQRDEKLAEAQKAQADLIRKQRELDDATREMDLTIEKRVQESLTSVRDKAKQEAEDGLKMKVLEKEQTIQSMQKQIEDLKRRAEQGSQQLQGEVQELEFENMLRMKFPRDTIEPVGKGEFGGDILHRVAGMLNQPCGTILWESKRTKNWSDGWLTKLREDQRAAKAEIAVIVSHALPKDVETFDLIDGIWVTSPKTIIPIAIVLRQSLIELAMARQAGEGQQTKMEMVYQYLTGTPQVMEDLKEINYIYAANGAGKTTVSRIIHEATSFAECSIAWKNGQSLQTVVYNRDFVDQHFQPSKELAGIFTLGEMNAEIEKSIEKAKNELVGLESVRTGLVKTYNGDNQKGGKVGLLKSLEDVFLGQCWEQKKAHEAHFDAVFDGFKKKETFKEKILAERGSNKVDVPTLEEMQAKAKLIFGSSKPISANPFNSISFEAICKHESQPILSKKVIGKQDIDIAKLIKKLGNSDWVRIGIQYLPNSNDVCPFCQQKAPKELAAQLEAYFDEEFEKDSQAITSLASSYNLDSLALVKLLDDMLKLGSPFMDNDGLAKEKEVLSAKISANLLTLEAKKKEPSHIHSLESLKTVEQAVSQLITKANQKISQHNAMVANLTDVRTAKNWLQIQNGGMQL